MTHTFATLQVSADAYDEIARRLKGAQYHHAFVDDVIDMHGLGLVRGEPLYKPDPKKQIDDLTRRLEMAQYALERVREYASDFPNLDACTAIIETVDDALAERTQGWQASQALSRKALWAFACETMRTACADEVGRNDKAGRQWVPGSFWDKVNQEAVARIRALPIPAMVEG